MTIRQGSRPEQASLFRDASGKENVISTTLVGLPPGTFGATLRHDGAATAVSNTFLYNDGAHIGDQNDNAIGRRYANDLKGNMKISNTGNFSNRLSLQEPSMAGVNLHITSFQAQTQPRDIYYTLPAVLLASDAILAVNSNGVMSWTNTLPPSVTTSFNQITSGINTGQNLQVGDTSILQPKGTGIIISNKLSGSTQGGNSYAGRVIVPQWTTKLTVNLTPSVGCTLNSSVTVSQFDAEGFGVIVGTMVTEIKQDAFTVQFSAAYPTTTGFITYLIVNP